MSMTFTSVALAVTNANEIIPSPSSKDYKSAKSLHTLAFSSKGHLLLNESQGSFDFDTWELVYERAYSICRGAKALAEDGDVSMDGKQNLESVIREVVEDKIYKEYSWAIDAV
jgi:exosome complex component RRP46